MSSEQATLTAFASLLDTSADAHEPTVEISSLRRLAARGIPSHPPHLRPTTYSVLLGVLPKHKARWKEERANGRRKYVDFAIRFLEDVEQAPPPTHPLSPNDRLLDEISKDVRRTQVHLDFFSKPVFASAASDEASPSTPSLPARLRSSLSHRIVRLSTTGKDARHNSPTRAKKLAVNAPPSPSPSMRSDDTARPSETRHDETSASPSDSPRNESLALPHIPELDFGTHSLGLVDSPAKASKPTNSTAASAVETSDFSTELHSDGLTRILYVFSLIHPQLSYTQGYAELLAPLYWVYASQGASLDDAASDEDDGGQWAEPDAFWAFLALMGEIGEVVKGPGHRPWGEVDLTVGGRPELDIQWALSRLSARVKWADETLWNDLRAKSLDPAQPFYAFRWVSTLLAQDVPLPSLLLIWDVILSEPPISHDSLPKVDLLLDVCTAMILLIRRPLLQAGRRRSAHIGLWETSEEDAGEFGPGFVEGMAILQRYPIEEIGVGRVIDLALESRQRRILAELNGDGPEDFQAVAFARTSTAAAATSTLSRLFKSHRSTPSVSAADVTRGTQGLASPTKARATSTYGASIARYAEAFRESDTAAALSKRSSNLTAAAVARWEDYQHRLPAVAEDEHSPSAPAENTLQTSNALTALRSSGETSPRPHFLDPSGGRTPVRRSSLSPSEPLRSPPTQDSRPQGRSLQDRLAASLATPPAATPPPRSHARSPSSGSGSKPLLLSSSAQPPSSSPSAASVLHATHRSRPAWATDPLLGNRAPATTERASSPPPHFAPSASDSEASSRIPIGGSRRRSGQLQHQQSPTPLSPPGPIRTTFLKTTPKTQEAGIKLRAVQDQFISSSASPSPIGRLSADLSANANGQRNLPRSPRSKGLGRPESFSSAGGDSDGDPAIRSGNWLARGMSGENTQRGWTLTDNGPVSVPLEPPATVLPPLERLQMADASSIAPTVSGVASSHISQHARNQSSTSSLGSPASPIGPRQPRKSSRAAVVSKQPARSTSSTRPHGRESSNPSDRDADDEDSTAEILESYGESDSAAGIR